MAVEPCHKKNAKVATAMWAVLVDNPEPTLSIQKLVLTSLETQGLTVDFAIVTTGSRARRHRTRRAS